MLGINYDTVLKLLGQKISTSKDLSKCWQWLAGKDQDGYGILKHKRKTHRAHRFVYEKVIGPIPAGLQLDHLCRNRSCVNPIHLQPVTNRENWRRGLTPSRIAADRKYCENGHKLEVIQFHGTRAGKRGCVICRKAKRHEQHLRDYYKKGGREKRHQRYIKTGL